jgi:hypothetical protein
MQLLHAAALVACLLCKIAASTQIAPSGSEVSAGSLQQYNHASSLSNSPAQNSSVGSVDVATDGECILDSTKPRCRMYEYSKDRATEDLEHLCKDQPYLCGCSLYKLCSQGVDPLSIGKAPQTCDRFKLLATVCQFDKLAANAKVS